jgi:hypothetical protein
LATVSAGVARVKGRAAAEISLCLVFKLVVAVAPRVFGVELFALSDLAETITSCLALVEFFAAIFSTARLAKSIQLLVAVTEGVLVSFDAIFVKFVSLLTLVDALIKLLTCGFSMVF